MSEFQDTSSDTASPSFVAQCEANRENHVPENPEIVEDDYEEDNQCHEELYEEKYWEQCELSKKESGFKKKFASECCKDADDFITYRKTNSKDQKERQLNKGYKLDRTTTLLIEKLIDGRNIGQYHDAIGESRNSIVIVAGKTVSKLSTYTYTFKNAIKIYKLSRDETKNKAIYQKVQNEFDNIRNIKTVHCCKNVIVMEHVGTDEKPAVPISMVPPELCCELYDKLIIRMTCLYDYRRMVHGNLNSKNVLYCDVGPHIVGWAHAVYSDHANAQKKLMRDCLFVTKFFKSKGVPVMSTELLFKEITKLREISTDALDVMHRNKCSSRSERANPGHGPGGASRFK